MNRVNRVNGVNGVNGVNDALVRTPPASTVDAAAPVPRAPPGLWRVLGPACVTWVAVATVIAFPGTWWVLVALGAAFGVTVVTLGFMGAARANRALLGGGAVLAALLLVVGARVGVEESHRVATRVDTAVTTGQTLDLRVRLSDFPLIESVPEGFPDGIDPAPERVSGWVPGVLVGEEHPTKVVLWMQHTEVQSADRTSVDQSSISQPQPAVVEDWAPGTELLVTGTPVALGPTSGAAYGIRAQSRSQLSPAPAPVQFAAGLRAELRDTAATLSGAELVPGFAVGDTALVGETLDAQMRASSLTHLVAVSGANCALVTSAAIWALSWLGCGRRLRAVAAALALLLFVLVVGPDASVHRAAIMGAVLLASSYGGKRSVALPALGLAIAVLLIIDPWQAWHPGFALSVAATGGIILCSPVISEILRRWGGLPRWIALPIAVAAAAQLACGPLLLLLQDGLPAAGVLANVLAGPAAPVGTALGLAALVAGPVSDPLAHALVAAASLPARWVEATARVASELPGARWDWLPGVPGALLLLATLALAVAAWMLATGRITRSGTRVRTPWRPDSLGPRGLRVGVAVLAGCAAGVFVGPTLVAPTVQRAGVPTNWRVVACDVGQGDAILLRGPSAGAGEAVLIDTGDDEMLLRACLRTFGITRITLLVLTHDDRDHVGALAAAAPLADAALIAPATVEDAGPNRDVTRQLERAEVPWQEGGAGDIGATAGVEWVLLAPDRRVTPGTSNGASLVMHAKAGDVTALLLADTGESEQAQLVTAAAAQQLAADVVKVAHHGSRDQQSGFYDLVGAELGLVSVGAENGYGHPARDTLEALIVAGTTALRTDEAGSIAVLGRDRGKGEVGGDGALQVWAQRGRAVGGDQ